MVSDGRADVLWSHVGRVSQVACRPHGGRVAVDRVCCKCLGGGLGGGQGGGIQTLSLTQP